MAACPFGVPEVRVGQGCSGRSQVHHVRQARGRTASQTACAEICPTGATLVRRPRRLCWKRPRSAFTTIPDTYLHHIFGETEVGGTSVLLLSSIGFNKFGFRTDLTERALPLYTYQVLSRIPDFVPLFGTMLGGIYWITHRREDVAEAEAKEKESEGGDPMTVPRNAFYLLEGRLPGHHGGRHLLHRSSASSVAGASTNLIDQFPWGLWIGFDVMCGVMLAAGGFTLTAAVEIFNIKRLHSIVRPTILDCVPGLPAGVRRADV